jgi:putative DNA methylase
MTIKPLEWKDKPALIEYLFPVQKISVESFKEQMAGSGKTLTALGSYWKGRKPLILNKACILGALLPATDNRFKDLQIFEMLMGMDKASLAIRLGRISPVKIAMRLEGLSTNDWFAVEPQDAKLPESTPFNVKDFPCVIHEKGIEKTVIPRLYWQDHITDEEKLELEAKVLPFSIYKENVSAAKRPEELPDSLFEHVWTAVNEHLGTSATSFPELIEQMGFARFGHRPRVADVFSGSGQIPFEAARLGCDVYASDLNPIACMLTWGTFNIVGANKEKREEIENAQKELADKVKAEIDALGVETDGNGWRAKVFLYCVEVRCPESGWMVPLLPSLIISKPRSGNKNNVVVKLVPVETEKRYEIEIEQWVNDSELPKFENGTVQNGYLVHSPDNLKTYRISLNTIRGDYKDGKENKNRLRIWEKSDFIPNQSDIFQERLFCVQWTRPKETGNGEEYEFRSTTNDDINREKKVIEYVIEHFSEWQSTGLISDMVIERGYNTDQPIRERGWSHWHHLFNPRQLLIAGFVRKHVNSKLSFSLTRLLNQNSRLSRWDGNSGGGGCVQAVFDNQALNTLYNYGCRGFQQARNLIEKSAQYSPIPNINWSITTHPAQDLNTENDIYITDPPYGDAVKYEEITEFFIAWLRKNPPPEFAHWTWDSRRALAVKGEDEGFRRGMIAAYRRMAEKMPDNGIQVLMFTHQSGSIWADMANIIWASGLQVTAAWYVVTETDSALRQGANVTGTIMLVLRKRNTKKENFRDDLAWEIEAAVKEQVESLTGLDKAVQAQESERLYNDADLQMAGYAAALKVLTAYSVIDGKDMVVEAEAPRIKGKKTFVDDLIDFAVQTAVQFLVPVGFEKSEWQKLEPVERFYLKMVEMEFQGNKTIDNYQNFAKAFKVHHFDQLMSDSSKANAARLKLSSEFKSSLMSGDAEIAETPLRALLYGMYLLSKETEIETILSQFPDNYKDYYANRDLLAKMASYIADKREGLKPSKTFPSDIEASNARVLAEAIRNQRL